METVVFTFHTVFFLCRACIIGADCVACSLLKCICVSNESCNEQLQLQMQITRKQTSKLQQVFPLQLARLTLFSFSVLPFHFPCLVFTRLPCTSGHQSVLHFHAFPFHHRRQKPLSHDHLIIVGTN